MKVLIAGLGLIGRLVRPGRFADHGIAEEILGVESYAKNTPPRRCSWALRTGFP